MPHFNSELFRQEVINIVGQIPRGRVLTYGQIARLAGFPCMPDTWGMPSMGFLMKPFRVIGS